MFIGKKNLIYRSYIMSIKHFNGKWMIECQIHKLLRLQRFIDQ